MKSCSNIVKLDPFIDEGILRVGRRIQRSALANEMQYPVLLQKSCRITELVVHSGVMNKYIVGIGVSNPIKITTPIFLAKSPLCPP